MKKLICAVIVAGSMFAGAEECAKGCESEKAVEAAPAAAEAVRGARKNRRQLSAEQRAKMREQRQKFMSEHKAKAEQQTLEIVRKYVPEEEKAKALVKELQEAATGARRNMRKRPAADKPSESR